MHEIIYFRRISNVKFNNEHYEIINKRNYFNSETRMFSFISCYRITCVVITISDFEFTSLFY